MTHGFSQYVPKAVGLSLALLASGSGASAAHGPVAEARRDGTNVVVRFTGRLQSAGSLDGPFASVAGAQSPMVLGAGSNTNQFWRSVLTDVRSIAAGDNFSMAVRNDGTLWSWGMNNYGQLGIGHTNYAVEPVQVGTDANWRTVSAGAGAYHASAIRDDGTLWAWGDNRFGQLGLGHTNQVLEPVQVGTNSIWESVSAGWRHTMAIRTDGTLWACGDNRFGQLGTGAAISPHVFVQVGSDAHWAQVSAGIGDYVYRGEPYTETNGSHTMGIKSDGTLWAWGNNEVGQLGIGVYTLAPAGVTEPTQVGTGNNWKSVSAGGRFTVALREDGTLWNWGWGYGMIGVEFEGTNQPVQAGTNSNWFAVSAGIVHTMALSVDGTLWTWGYDAGGQLGIATSANEYGTRYAAVSGPPPWQVGANHNWSVVASGTGQTIASREDGSIWTWGAGANGRVTVGSSSDEIQIGHGTNWQTVDAGCDFTIALRDDGTLWGWGWNEHGLLGLGVGGDRNTPTQIGTDADWQSVDAGSSQIVALKNDGTMWTWGRGKNGPAQVGSETNWVTASAGGDSTEIYYDGRHFAALRRDGTLWTWGDNGYGQLGIGDTTPWPYYVSEVTQVGTNADWMAVSAGWFHTLAIKRDGTLWAWGANGPGALGLGGSVQGTNRPIRVGQDADWVAVYAGRFASRALKSDGTLWAWGNIGTPPNPNSITTNQPVQVGVETDWRHVTADDNHFYRAGADPAWPWKSIASGWRHFVGIRRGGTLWASGNNFVGQLAQPAFWAPAPIAGTDWGSPALQP